MNTLAERLKFAREKAQLSQAALAKRAGIGQSTLASIENGRNHSSAKLVEIAAVLGVSVEWLATGRSGKSDMPLTELKDRSQSTSDTAAHAWPFPSVPQEKLRNLKPTQLAQLDGALLLALGLLENGVDVAKAVGQPKRGSLFVENDGQGAFPMAAVPGLTDVEEPRAAYPAPHLSKDQSLMVNVAPGRPIAANDKFEDVPELGDVRLAAGEGIENHIEDQTGVMHFRQSFLRSVGADRGNARVVYAKGDSMEPVIRDGAALLLVLDEGLTLQKAAAGGVYAINYDGKMLVKAIAKDKLTGKWVARSFNPSYPDIPLEGDVSVRVLGQIVWEGSRLWPDEARKMARS